MYFIEQRIKELITFIDIARNKLKEKLSKKNIDFNNDDSLRRLISLIPNNYEKPIDLPYSVYNHTGVNIVKNILFSGGLISDSRGVTSINRQELYNIDTNTFSSKLNIPYNVDRHTAVNIDGSILISGGSLKNVINTQVLYNIDTNIFSNKLSIPYGVYEHTGVNVDGNILISGGYIGGGAVTNRQELYNIDSNTFSSKLNIPYGVYEHTGVNVNGNILISGGYVTNRQELYNVNTNTFSSEINTPYNIYNHTGMNVNGSVLISGGNTAGGSNENYIIDQQKSYNVKSKTFSSNFNMPYFMMNHTAVNIGKNILFSGGSTKGNKFINNQELYLLYQDKFVL